MKRNIAIILEATLGGTRKHVVDLLYNLPLDNFNIHFIYSKERADNDFLCNIENLRKTGIVLCEIKMNSNILSFKNFFSLFKVRRYIKSNKIQILHLHGAIAAGIGRLSAILVPSVETIIYTPHGGVFHKMHGFKGYFYYIIEKILISKKLFFIAVSNSQKHEIINKLHIANEKIFLIHNGISIPSFIFDESKKDDILHDINCNIPNPLVILYPALFLEAKGHIEFFLSLKNSKKLINTNVIFLLAGDGPLLEQTKEIVGKISYLKEKIIFLGFTTQMNIYYQLCDIVILPSKGEAFGYVALESFQYKKPIFSTRVGGLLDLINDGIDGKFFSVDKIDDFIDDINYYTEHKNELKIFGENGFLKLQSKFSLQHMVDKTVAIYEINR